MCGRFVQLPLAFPDAAPWPHLREPLTQIRTRYNLAPTQRAAVVLDAGGTPSLLRLRWGLIPPWAKDLKGSFSTINARIETIATLSSYRSAWKARRCVIPMGGYYEWVDTPSGKQPYFISRRDGGDLWAAAIWEPRHRLQGDDEDGSCSIITHDARDAAGQVHDRMPVFLEAHMLDAFMQATPEEAMQILLAAPVPDVTVRAVDKRVNSTRNGGADDAGLITPIDD